MSSSTNKSLWVVTKSQSNYSEHKLLSSSSRTDWKILSQNTWESVSTKVVVCVWDKTNKTTDMQIFL